MITVYPGDCLAVIPRLVGDGVRVDAIVCDPPYGLEFMGKEWDRFRGSNTGIKKSGYEKLGQHGTPSFDANRHNQKCPRCSKWAYDYPDRKCLCGGAAVEGRRLYCSAFQEWTQAWGGEAIQILRPGGFLVAFGGTRTYHRMACGLEDAGFVIQDTLAWLYGTGFPKGRAMLKPAYEPIVLAYKPGASRTMQIDECRIATNEQWVTSGALSGGSTISAYGNGLNNSGRSGSAALGRWPANVLHDGSAEVLAAFPQSAGQQGDIRGTEPSCQVAHTNGIYGAKKTMPFNKRDGEASANRRYTDEGASDFAMLPGMRRSDAGSAARFFFSAKAGAQDRWGSRHPTVKPVELMKWLVALVCPPGGLLLDPFAGSGTTGIAALATGRSAILIEREPAYVADIRERLAHYKGNGGHSAQAKHRNRAVDHGPLFASVPLSPEEDAADSILSYNDAIGAIGERVKAGEPVPGFMLSQKAQP